MTDEQNYRTLGCYRERLEESQKFIWGEGVKVETPHLDSLAHDGAMYTNFFASSPICTPARASFATGLYPNATGASSNGDSLNDDAVTFARILELNQYHTAYVGKWHLNGEKKPGWLKKKDNSFGFKMTKYLFNRGHYKFFKDKANGSVKVHGWTKTALKKYRGRYEKHYATDFLTDRAITYMKKRKKSKKPFAIMLSLPDPHNPTNVRKPYDTMFNNMTFQVPETAVNALKAQPGLPLWANLNINPKTIGVRIKKIKPYEADYRIQQLTDSALRQKTLRETFGMVKLIDDNVGKILNFLNQNQLDNNTIVVFTSDHGDMMGEHLRHNKLVPYDTSAGVPFLIRYPGHIIPGKVVETAHSGTDFAPTILSLMGANLTHDDVAVDFHGFDGSAELLNDVRIINDKNQVRFMTSSVANTPWAVAFTSQYKLVLSNADVPWFYNKTSDPDEIINVYDDKSTKIRELKEHLHRAMIQYKMPLADTRVFFWDMPSCRDSPNSFATGKNNELQICSSVLTKQCNWPKPKGKCPQLCETCAGDSDAMFWLDGNLTTCDQLPAPIEESCKFPKSKQICSDTCVRSRPPSSQPSLLPTMKPSTRPTLLPTTTLSTQPTLLPSVVPSDTPSHIPTVSTKPSATPSESPSREPSTTPSRHPSDVSSDFPSGIPSRFPSLAPNSAPSVNPTESPSRKPSTTPSGASSDTPSDFPFATPSRHPSDVPLDFPSGIPSGFPSLAPNSAPSVNPTESPNRKPSTTPSRASSDTPSDLSFATPSRHPSDVPLDFLSGIPSGFPSLAHSGEPSVKPPESPSHEPSTTPSTASSDTPSDLSSGFPSGTLRLTGKPSADPSEFPSHAPYITLSRLPSDIPSDLLPEIPSGTPSLAPRSEPTGVSSTSTPTTTLSALPYVEPSAAPSDLTSHDPTQSPYTEPSAESSGGPSHKSSANPSRLPSDAPSNFPFMILSGTPSLAPWSEPSARPSEFPSHAPSEIPSRFPSDALSSGFPSEIPSGTLLVLPSVESSAAPSDSPSHDPTLSTST